MYRRPLRILSTMSPRELDDETKHIATFDPAVAHACIGSRRRRDPDVACVHGTRAARSPRAGGRRRRAALSRRSGPASDVRRTRGAARRRPGPGRADSPTPQSLRHTGRADTRRSLAKSRTNRTCPVTTHDPRRVRRLRTTMQIMRPWMHAAQITNRTTSRPRTQSPASRVPPRVAYAACSLGRGVHHVHTALARPLHL